MEREKEKYRQILYARVVRDKMVLEAFEALFVKNGAPPNMSLHSVLPSSQPLLSSSSCAHLDETPVRGCAPQLSVLFSRLPLRGPSNAPLPRTRDTPHTHTGRSQ